MSSDTEFSCQSLVAIFISRAEPLKLNRQVITLLEQKGVPSQEFYKLQDAQLNEILLARVYETKAKEQLKKSAGLLRINYLAKRNVRFCCDPFFASLLREITRSKLGIIKL